MKTFFINFMMLLCLSNAAYATGPRVSAALFTPLVNEIFALDFPLILSSDAQDGGIAAALIKAAFQVEQTESTITPLPLQTMVSYYLNQENALAIVGHDLNLTPAEAKNTIVIPILILRESYFYSRLKHESLNWQGKLDGFKGLTVGVHKGDSSTFDAKLGIKVEQNRLEARIKALIEGKIDVVRESDLTRKIISFV
jgi:polar amino acid transport system substrate-binding protein